MTDIIRPGVAAAGSQVTVTDRLRAAAPASRPFVVYQDTDLTGTATGNANVESYCSWAPAAASRYQLNRPDHNQIFRFDLTTQGITIPTYCLDKFRDGPYGGVPSTLERREKGPTSRRPHTLRTSQGQPRKPIRGSFTSPGVSASAGQHWISALPQRQADAPSPVWAGAASA